MTPYYDEDGITIYHGDCREVLPTIGDVANVVVTDPPYSSGGLQEMQRASGSVGTRTSERVQFDTLSTRGYERLMQEVLRHCNQADELYLCTDWRMWIHAFDVAETTGWRVANMLVWDKKHIGMGAPWRSQHELVLFGKRAGAAARAGKRSNVIAASRTGNKHHPTEKPVELMAALIDNSAPGLVLDPFAGSGTSLVAAKKSARHAIGIEIDERYCEIAAKRLAQGVLDFGGGAS